jgi:hypothetical protein
MLSKVLALSALAVTEAATGSVSALCATLTGSVCGGSMFPAGTTATQCESLIGAAVGVTSSALGDDTDTSGNTIGCRQHYSSMASATATHWCLAGGFTGAGLCGDVLINSCNAIHANCNGIASYPFASSSACQTNNSAIAAVFGSLQGPSGASEESLECRVYHSLVGQAAGGATPHCGHVSFPGAAGAWCGGNVSTNSAHYCMLHATVCNVSTPTPRIQYNNWAQCTASFATFVNGNVDPNNGANDKGCRQYHTNAGMAVGLVHCHHGGPSGGTVCGGANSSRSAWQSLAGVTNCATATYGYIKASIDAAFANWNAADLLAIVPMGSDLASFSTGSSGDTDTCRLYHLTVASTDATHCDHGSILGGGACGNPVTVACRVFQTACGTTAFASQTACETQIAGYFPNKTGTPSTGATTNDDIACRMYQAGVALAKRKSGAAVATECNGLKAPGATVCKGTAKSSAAVVAVSVFALLPTLFAL